MDTLVAAGSLVLQLLVPLAIALPVARLLEPATRAALLARCGSEAAADYWARTLRVLWLSVPVAGVLLLFNEANWRCDLLGGLRQIVALSLLGVIVSVLAVAWRIARSIAPQSVSTPATARPQP